VTLPLGERSRWCYNSEVVVVKGLPTTLEELIGCITNMATYLGYVLGIGVEPELTDMVPRFTRWVQEEPHIWSVETCGAAFEGRLHHWAYMLMKGEGPGNDFPCFSFNREDAWTQRRVYDAYDDHVKATLGRLGHMSLVPSSTQMLPRADPRRKTGGWGGE